MTFSRFLKGPTVRINIFDETQPRCKTIPLREKNVANSLFKAVENLMAAIQILCKPITNKA